MKAYCIVSVIILAVFLAAPGRTAPCTVEDCYGNPMGTVGCELTARGRVTAVISVSLPLEFIMEVKGQEILVQFFGMAVPAGVSVREGTKLTVHGTHLGARKVLVLGTAKSIPALMCQAMER